MEILIIIFWVFAAIVFYTYIGYGILLRFSLFIKELFVKKSYKLSGDAGNLRVTLLIAAYNEEEIVPIKMENCRTLSYPSEMFKIVWVTDGSDDSTNTLLSNYPEVSVLYKPERRGKTAAINRAMDFIDSDIVVFTDANTMLNSEAILKIAECFSDPVTGCVAGEKRIAVKAKDKASSGGEGLYWRYESKLKEWDSRLNSAVGAAGELFAIRRELFEPMRVDTLLDDFVLSMKIAQKGYKIAYCSDAYAVEEGSLNMQEEKKRKVRIAAGGIQAVFMLKPLLNFFKYGTLTFQYISHRVLRWTITPVLLFLLFPLTLIIAIYTKLPFYYWITGGQALFYLLAYVGKILQDKRVSNKLLFVPYYFLFMNYNVIKGFGYLYKKRRGDGTWERAARRSSL